MTKDDVVKAWGKPKDDGPAAEYEVSGKPLMYQLFYDAKGEVIRLGYGLKDS